jgi:hypothetical protein
MRTPSPNDQFLANMGLLAANFGGQQGIGSQVKMEPMLGNQKFGANSFPFLGSAGLGSSIQTYAAVDVKITEKKEEL